MWHNRAYRSMFRYRSLAAFVLLSPALVFSVGIPTRPFANLRAQTTTTSSDRLLTGVDVYDSMNSEPFAGKRIGLITNQTGVDSRGLHTSDAFAGTGGGRLVALFSPEHGINGTTDGSVASVVGGPGGVPIYSLYGETRRPTDAMLKDVDVLVLDIQDAGVRFYTFVTTMAYCMEAAAKHHIPFVVFDRPDPLGGEVIEGPMLDPNRISFTGYFPMPVRYGMTLGELAQMFNAENKIGADLHVFAMRGWHRADAYDQTGLAWIPPSPNLRTVNEAFLYSGIEILQAGGVSVGRGTGTPFEVLGAPWIRADEFAADLNRRKIPGVEFVPAQFTPSADPFSGQVCHGVRI